MKIEIESPSGVAVCHDDIAHVAKLVRQGHEEGTFVSPSYDSNVSVSFRTTY